MIGRCAKLSPKSALSFSGSMTRPATCGGVGAARRLWQEPARAPPCERQEGLGCAAGESVNGASRSWRHRWGMPPSPMPRLLALAAAAGAAHLGRELAGQELRTLTGLLQGACCWGPRALGQGCTPLHAALSGYTNERGQAGAGPAGSALMHRRPAGGGGSSPFLPNRWAAHSPTWLAGAVLRA